MILLCWLLMSVLGPKISYTHTKHLTKRLNIEHAAPNYLSTTILHTLCCIHFNIRKSICRSTLWTYLLHFMHEYHFLFDYSSEHWKHWINLSSSFFFLFVFGPRSSIAIYFVFYFLFVHFHSRSFVCLFRISPLSPFVIVVAVRCILLVTMNVVAVIFLQLLQMYFANRKRERKKMLF